MCGETHTHSTRISSKSNVLARFSGAVLYRYLQRQREQRTITYVKRRTIFHLVADYPHKNIVLEGDFGVPWGRPKWTLAHLSPSPSGPGPEHALCVVEQAQSGEGRIIINPSSCGVRTRALPQQGPARSDSWSRGNR